MSEESVAFTKPRLLSIRKHLEAKGDKEPLTSIAEWSARHFLYQLRSDKTGTRGAVYEARDEAYCGAGCESAAAG